MRKILFNKMSRVYAVVMIAVLIGAPIAEASCPGGNNRLNWTTTWAFCSMPSAFQSKVRAAITTWDAWDKYSYTEAAGCAYAFSWGYASFNTRYWGNNPGVTYSSYGTGGKITGSVSYFNGDRTWYDATCDGCAFPANQFDRFTVALHETGHWMQLRHPSDCAQNVPTAAMEPNNVTKRSLRSDDTDGLYRLGILR